MMARGPAALLGAAALAGCASVVDTPPGVIEGSAARYACSDGTRFSARFDPFGEMARLTFDHEDRDDPDAPLKERGFRVVLAGQRVASGIWYAGGGWSLRGKGDVADLTRPDGRVSRCRTGEMPAGRRGSV